jgi:hypothetical protein
MAPRLKKALKAFIESLSDDCFVRPPPEGGRSILYKDDDFHLDNQNENLEIAVRGYNKFFNRKEVRKTEWDNVQGHTKGLYELSVKEND